MRQPSYNESLGRQTVPVRISFVADLTSMYLRSRAAVLGTSSVVTTLALLEEDFKRRGGLTLQVAFLMVPPPLGVWKDILSNQLRKYVPGIDDVD